MELNVVSDLHFEFLGSRRAEQDIVAQLAEADVLVVAGDLSVFRFLDQARDTLRLLVDKFGEVVYVPGNHEYYGSSPGQVEGILRIVEQEIYGLNILRPGSVAVVRGQKFVGGTLWFPDGYLNTLNRGLLTDFQVIKGFVPWVYEQNMLFRKTVPPLIDTSTVVVSHHLPSAKSVANKYRHEITNIFFVSDEERTIVDKQPKLWVHGHTHEVCDYTIGSTRVVCNPMGYPYEGKPFDFAKIVEV